MIEIYTDGSCNNRTGHGGWGVVIKDRAVKKTFQGEAQNTTSNRMELKAAIEGVNQALKLGKEKDGVLFSDSKYVVDGANKWLSRWKQRGWKTANKQEVKNKDLWKALDALLIKWENIHDDALEVGWVKAHNGDPLNELADDLARDAMNRRQGKYDTDKKRTTSVKATMHRRTSARDR